MESVCLRGFHFQKWRQTKELDGVKQVRHRRANRQTDENNIKIKKWMENFGNTKGEETDARWFSQEIKFEIRN
jgi:hypothetical protein